MRRSATSQEEEEINYKKMCYPGAITQQQFTGYGQAGGSHTVTAAGDYNYIQTLQHQEDISDKLLRIEISQSTMLCSMSYPSPVSFVYNPIDYAFDVHRTFVKRFCASPKTILFLGMNPGPFGMVQNGVPFGEIKMVKDWLKIDGEVGKPPYEHPQRPILGFQCSRSEVSGQRFWEFFKELCGTPETFFYNSYVHNYCPVAFMTETAKNVTPPELPISVRKTMLSICDKALLEVIQLLGVKVIVGVGRFAHERAMAAVKAGNLANIQTGFLMHPSPINPAANKGWKAIAFQQLQGMGIMHLLGAQTQRPPEAPV